MRCRSTHAASSAAEHAEFRAVRMVESNGSGGIRKGVAEFELRIVGDQRAGKDRRTRRALLLHHDPRRRVHHVQGRLVQYAPAFFGDLRDIDTGVHLGEENQRRAVERVDRNAMFSKQPGLARTDNPFRFA